MNGIRRCVGVQSAEEWEDFERVLQAPPENDLQTDSWSCGLFVMIALRVFSNNWMEPLVGRSRLEPTRREALKALADVP